MGTIGRKEVQHDLAHRHRKPPLFDDVSMMIASVVDKDVDETHRGMRAFNVQPLAAGRLLHRDGDVLARPAASRPDRMSRMDHIDESDRLIGAHRVEQVLVFVDEGLLSGVVEAARHGLRLAIVEAQAMQQAISPERL